MSLLPRSQAEFQQKDYWEKFFSKRSAPFEWYGEYLDLCDTIHKYTKPSSRILVVGCGNSKLSEDMYDTGFHRIDNIDISDVVIRQMISRNKLSRPDMKFIKMDLLDMTYDDATFDCVIDKGTLDAIYSNTDDATVQKVDRMFQEVGRVLKIAGRYLCITLAQDHILQKLLQYFNESDWLLRVHQVLLGRNDAEGSGLGGALPVFVFVMTKMARIAGRPPLKVSLTTESGSFVLLNCFPKMECIYIYIYTR